MNDQQSVGRRHAVRMLGTAGAVGAGAALLGTPGARGEASAADAFPPIVGTWYITSPGLSTELIQIYNADGTHLSIHDQHTVRSPQAGVWEQVGEREFLKRNLSFRFDETSGARTGSIEVRGRYSVDASGMTMRGQGVRLEMDLAGNLLEPPIPWTSEATRLVVVPIE